MKIIGNIQESYTDLNDVNRLVKFIEKFRNKSELNIQILSRYTNLLDKLMSAIDFVLLNRKKDLLREELDLSKIKHKSSELSAKTNRLNKLNEEISKNKKEMAFLEEDFSKIQGQRSQILSEINKYKNKIDKLNKLKKSKFDKINQITRSMESRSAGEKGKLDLGLDLSNAEMFKKLRQEAKEIHYETKKMKEKLRETRLKLEDFDPKYKTLKKDYNSLKKTINQQETQIKEIQNDINMLMEESNDGRVKKIDFTKLPNIRNQEVIKTEIEQIQNRIKRLKKSSGLINEHGTVQDKISFIRKELDKLLKEIKGNEKILRINPKKETYISAVESFRKVELIIKTLEDLMNKFLKEIDLNVNLQFSIGDKSTQFFLYSAFTRHNKEALEFADLTTPEKVFCMIVLYLSLNIVLNKERIVFSNLFLHQNFNKRGSIFRTFRKIIPVIKDTSSLKDYSFIIIISKLPIENSISPGEQVKIINYKDLD